MTSSEHVGRRAVPIPVSIVRVCLRGGRGGSPTAVVEDAAPAALTDAERRLVAVRFGTSHAVFVRRRHAQTGPGEVRAAEKPTADLRFFTAAGELPACGHGTVAALALLAGRGPSAGPEFGLRAGGRTFTGRAVRDGDTIHAAFDPGPVTLRTPSSAEIHLVCAALGMPAGLVIPGARIATLGRARILIPVAAAEPVKVLAPNFGQLRTACDQLGLLGCYVHTAPTSGGRVLARMFAPSIGVPEDIANANSTACLAAHVAGQGFTDLAVDMGDALGSPATITASALPGPTGPKILVGGNAAITRTTIL